MENLNDVIKYLEEQRSMLVLCLKEPELVNKHFRPHIIPKWKKELEQFEAAIIILNNLNTPHGLESVRLAKSLDPLKESFDIQKNKSQGFQKTINLCAASIIGALDGLELDNTCDVVEKSYVIEQLREQLGILRGI